METTVKSPAQEEPENIIIYAPMEEIRTVEDIIYKLEITQRELQKVIEGMKPVESNKPYPACL